MLYVPPTVTDTDRPWESPPNRKRWTRRECEFLEQNNMISGRYELLDGDIIYKTPQSPPHSYTVVAISIWLRRIFGGEYVCDCGAIEAGAAELEFNVPEPDVVVQTKGIMAFATRFPGPADLALVVEVSDTTLRSDLGNKAALYARAGIVEYWVADIVGRRFVAHRAPTPSGYADITEYAHDAHISCLSRPDITALVSDLLPPVQSQP